MWITTRDMFSKATTTGNRAKSMSPLTGLENFRASVLQRFCAYGADYTLELKNSFTRFAAFARQFLETR
jgi:hypothetical protein